MSHRIAIDSLELWTHIGVPEEERACEQRVLVSLEITCAGLEPPDADDLEGMVDYERVVQDLRLLAQEERLTIERLAEDIAAVILGHDAVESVTVSVQKFPLPGVRSISLTITRP
ncbi:MAG: dihydroneopterin aldolase [Candidatus Peribacteraceae bacterium]|nr:dihydroneopterin aldolase [Candidatus Peribacteraceae bacterium]